MTLWQDTLEIIHSLCNLPCSVLIAVIILIFWGSPHCHLVESVVCPRVNRVTPMDISEKRGTTTKNRTTRESWPWFMVRTLLWYHHSSYLIYTFVNNCGMQKQYLFLVNSCKPHCINNMCWCIAMSYYWFLFHWSSLNWRNSVAYSCCWYISNLVYFVLFCFSTWLSWCIALIPGIWSIIFVDRYC